ncbi:MAG: hypothetical protein EA408_06585 [Marinilabiliales bacterium]|nr:MAG: hypothetical protein EA408_06585 [Marinilabiliales bacterium]
MRKPELNSQTTGLVAGLVLPLLTFLVFYLIRYGDISIPEFIRYVWFRGILASLLSLNILPNLAIFYLFIRKNYLFSARGVLFATFSYAGVILIVKVLSG